MIALLTGGHSTLSSSGDSLMIEYSTVDGFAVINENIEDMIKYVANEPSVGLYFIQQHAQNAVPNLIKLKTSVNEKSREATLHTEDLDESTAITRTMKQCGSPIIDEMIQDIKTSLAIVKESITQQQSLNYEMTGSSFWAPTTWARGIVGDQNNDGNEGGSYLYNMFKSSKDKLESLKKPDEVLGDSSNLLSASNEYDDFKADREAKLEEWLKGSGSALENGTGDTQGQSLV